MIHRLDSDGCRNGDMGNHSISIVRSLWICMSKHQMLTDTSGSSMERLLVLPRLTIFEWILVHTCGVYRCWCTTDTAPLRILLTLTTRPWVNCPRISLNKRLLKYPWSSLDLHCITATRLYHSMHSVMPLWTPCTYQTSILLCSSINVQYWIYYKLMRMMRTLYMQNSICMCCICRSAYWYIACECTMCAVWSLRAVHWAMSAHNPLTSSRGISPIVAHMLCLWDTAEGRILDIYSSHLCNVQ